MHFPKFWVLARRGGVCAWGWSDVSPAAAQAEGEARVARIMARLAGTDDIPVGRYGYPDRPMREEILQEFPGAEDGPRAVVSRNSYGCVVLNATHALFVDVDETAPGFLRSLRALFGKRPAGFEEDVLARVARWNEGHPGWGWRAYRTKAGIRLLATHEPVSADDPRCAGVFQEFKADLLYRKLCVNQKCFRARLTPKPWRCGSENPPHRWPWRNADEEAAFQNWEKSYRHNAEPFAVCRLLGQFGPAAIHPHLTEIVAFHDKATGAESERPLA